MTSARPLADHAAVLADLDGTLIDSDLPVRRAWTAFAARHGLDADEVMRFARGRPPRETARELAPDAPEEPARTTHADADLRAAGADAIVDDVASLL